MALSTIPTAGLSSDQGVNFRNLIINGDMSIAQRGAGPSGSFGGSGYSEGPDRWRHSLNSCGNWQTSQSTDVPSGQGFASSLKLDCTSAAASLAATAEFQMLQRMEGQMLQQLKKGTSNAESTTISFWVKSNKTGTYIVRISDSDNSRHIAKSYTINSSSTWEKKTITFDGDTSGVLNNDNARSIDIQFFLAAGSNLQSGTLATSWEANTTANQAVGQVNVADSTSNEWYLTGVQWEVGTSASDFEFLPRDINLQRCQRYYRRFKSTGQTEDDFATIYGNVANGDHIMVGVPLSPTMRSVPSVSIDNPLSIDDHFRSSRTQSSANCVINGNGKGTYIVLKCGNFSSMSEGNTIQFSHNTTTVTIQFSSEL